MQDDNSAVNPSILYTATLYANSGLSPLPIRLDGSKAPCFSWIPAQRQIADEATLSRWFGDNQVGIAIACGKVSGNLEVLDFDEPKVSSQFLDAFQEENPALLKKLVFVSTPRPGMQILYRCSEKVAGNQKLARCPVDGEYQTVIETRGEGGYVLVPGNPPEAHPSGRLYEELTGSLRDIPVIEPDERQDLLTLARSFNVEEVLDTQVDRRDSPRSADDEPPGTIYMKQEGHRKEVMLDILGRHGWTLCRSRGDITYLTRPDKDPKMGHSATVGARVDSDKGFLFLVFTSNDPVFDGPRGESACAAYDLFNVFAKLEHNGDYSAAASALRSRGYVKASNGRQTSPQAPQRDELPMSGDPSDRPEAPPSDEILPVRNFFWEETKDPKGNLVVDSKGQQKWHREPIPPEEILTQARKVIGDTFRSEGGVLFRIRKDENGTLAPYHIKKSVDFSSYIHEESLTPKGVVSLEFCDGVGATTKDEFLTYVTNNSLQFDAVLPYPVFPKPGNVYVCNQVEPILPEGITGQFLDFFHPATPLDRDLLYAMLLTLMWGGEPGSRPLFLLRSSEEDEDNEDNGTGTGKTTLAELFADVVGGSIGYSVDAKRDDFSKRLLNGQTGFRVIIADNFRMKRGDDTAMIEEFCTRKWLDGHSYYSGNKRIANYLVWILTANSPQLVKDLAKRLIAIRLKSFKYSPKWEASVEAFLKENRHKIIGECLHTLMQPFPDVPTKSKFTRWSAWELAVLARCGDLQALQAYIKSGQGTTDRTGDDYSAVEISIHGYLAKRSEDRGESPPERRFSYGDLDLLRWLSQSLGRQTSANEFLQLLRKMKKAGRQVENGERIGQDRVWKFTGDIEPLGQSRNYTFGGFD